MRRATCVLLMLAIGAGWHDHAQGETLAEFERALRHPDREKRIEALNSRFFYGSKCAELAPALAAFLDDPDPEVRADAAGLLQAIGPSARPALDALRRALDDESILVRMSAADAVWEINRDAEAVVPVFVGAMTNENAYWAGSSLGEIAIHDPLAVARLTAILSANDSPEGVKVSAARALDRTDLSRDDVVTALRGALADPSVSVRTAAAESLWRQGIAARELLPVFIESAGQIRERAPIDATEIMPWHHGAREVAALLAELGPEADASVPILVNILTDDDAETRIAAADALSAIGPEARSAIDPLAAAMRDTEVHTFPFAHRSWCLSDNAAAALRNIGDVALPKLVEAVRADDARLRMNAAHQLGWFPDHAHDMVGLLIERLNDPDVFVRIVAARSLRQIGIEARPAGPALAGLLRERGEFTSFPAGMGIGVNLALEDEAAAALVQIDADPQTVVPVLVEVLNQTQRVSPAMARVLRHYGPRAAAIVPRLEPFLDDPEQSSDAGSALAAIAPEDPRWVDVLSASLSWEAPRQAVVAASALGGLGDRARAAAPKLRKMLAEDDSKHEPFVRAILAAALLRIEPGDEADIVVLANALHEPGWVWAQEEFDEALRVWGNLGPRAEPGAGVLSTGLKLPELRDKDFDDLYAVDSSRLRCARLLRTIPGLAAEVVPTLIEICQLGDSPERSEACDALAELGPRGADAVGALIDLLDDEERYVVNGDFYGNGGQWRVVGDRAVLALASIGPPAVADLRTALASTPRSVRRRAAEALGKMGPAAAEARPELLTALDDPSPWVRAAAADALGRIGGDAAQDVPALVALLTDGRLDPRRAAAEALAQYGADAAPAVDALAGALTDERLAMRIAAAKALAAIGPAAAPALPALTRLLDDEYAKARAAAAEAMEHVNLPE
jgi:HEAT repeat protein